MVSQERSTQTNRSPFVSRQLYGLKLTDALRFISSLLLPLVLGIFTAVITIQQQNSAAKQRQEDQKAAQLQLELERNLNDIKYRNEVLDTYVKEMGQLLEKYNGSLTSNEVMATLARAKTLNTFRQLDPQRNVRIIRFLYEAKQLSGTQKYPSLDLSTAKLRDMDFRDSAVNEKRLDHLSLTSIFLSNSTFIGIEMNNVNFGNTQFDTVNFSYGMLYNVNFTSATFDNANFSFNSLVNATFSSTKFTNANFSYTQLDNVNFSSAKLDNIDFSSTRLHNVDFSSASLVNVNFLCARLVNVKFSPSTLHNVNFSSAELKYVDFLDAELYNTNFSFAILGSVDFSRTNASYTDFQYASCVAAGFNYANLSYSSFGHSNVKHALFMETDLTNVNFSNANLYKAEFTGTNISDSQLQSALSIEDTRLPNQTLARDPNLINNGQADCNIHFANSWTLLTGNITTMILDNKTNDCNFVLQSYNTGATMFQRVDISKKWDSKSWPSSMVVLTARMSIDVYIRLRGISINNSVSDWQTLSSTKENIYLILRDDMRKFEVLIEFSAFVNQSTKSYWCDDIRLFIVYDIDLESLQDNSTKWKQYGITIAGGNGIGSQLNQLSNPCAIYVDDNDQCIYIADYGNHRIVEWKYNSTIGQVVAGGNEKGSETDKLYGPTYVIVDKKTDSLIICDSWNNRVVQWPRRNGTNGQIIISQIGCSGLTMDNNGYLYVSDAAKNEVRRFKKGEANGTIVAGGNGKGSNLNQLNWPGTPFVDQDHSVYLSDINNHRVMKWMKNATEGVVVAGGRGQGNSSAQLSSPGGVMVDHLGGVYVVDGSNNRIMHWPKGSKEGRIIVGGNGPGAQPNQLWGPASLSFDRKGNLYVADWENNRVQKFEIDSN